MQWTLKRIIIAMVRYLRYLHVRIDEIERRIKKLEEGDDKG